MHIFFLILSIVLISVGQVLQKKATQSEPFVNLPKDHRLYSVLTYNFLLSVIAQILSTVFWIFALSGIELSIANPLMSLSYVIVMISSKIIFNEDIPLRRWFGIALISLGIIIIYNS